MKDFKGLQGQTQNCLLCGLQLVLFTGGKNKEKRAERQEERKTNCAVFENKKAESN